MRSAPTVSFCLGAAHEKGQSPFLKTALFPKEKRGVGGSRTRDGGFAIRCLSHLATTPYFWSKNHD